MISYKTYFREGIPCCYVGRQDIDVIMQSKLQQRRYLLNGEF